MDINSDTLYSQLLYSDPVIYNDNMTLYPIKMENVIDFNLYKSSIVVRKNSVFPIKQIIKMPYMDFLFFVRGNMELAVEYKMPLLPYLYDFAFQLLKLVFRDQEVLASTQYGGFMINGEIITSDQFDDIRRIIIVQNGLDFNIDEFIHFDTEKKLESAQDMLSKDDKASLEDYIDSVCLAFSFSEEQVKNMTIRKFWRYVKRISKRDIYTIAKTAETSGMVKYDKPISYWMDTIEETDKYKDVKTDASSIKKMVNG